MIGEVVEIFHAQPETHVTERCASEAGRAIVLLLWARTGSKSLDAPAALGKAGSRQDAQPKLRTPRLPESLRIRGTVTSFVASVEDAPRRRCEPCKTLTLRNFWAINLS